LPERHYDRRPCLRFRPRGFRLPRYGAGHDAVDSYGPVTDNAQSVYELSLIEQVPGIQGELKKDYNIDVNFERAKTLLEANDGAGNTFKATAKPVLIGTAVVRRHYDDFLHHHGANHGLTVNVEKLSLLTRLSCSGLITGGAMIYWFTGASTQAVTTGAYRAVEFIKDTLSSTQPRPPAWPIAKKSSKSAPSTRRRACSTSSSPCSLRRSPFLSSNFLFHRLPDVHRHVRPLSGHLHGQRGGAWDNAKKIVEVELKQKGTPLHDATVVGGHCR